MPYFDPPAPRLAAITGPSGYVGVNLIPRLLALGWTLRTVGHGPLAGNATDGVVHTVADVRDRAALLLVFDGVEVVFHVAARITLARQDSDAWDINVRGPATAAAAACETGVARMVHCSSVHALDLALAAARLDESSPRSTDPQRPLYDRSKFAGECEVRKAIDAGLDATIVNPTGVIGPIDLGPSRINRVIRSAARGRLPLVVSGGFDWVDVRDVVEGLISAVERGRTGENYLLPGHHSSVLHLGRLAAAFTGRLGPIAAVPASIALRAAPVGEVFNRRFGFDLFTPASVGALVDDPRVDGDKARRELGHAPRPLEETIRDTVQWFEGDADRELGGDT